MQHSGEVKPRNLDTNTYVTLSETDALSKLRMLRHSARERTSTRASGVNHSRFTASIVVSAAGRSNPFPTRVRHANSLPKHYHDVSGIGRSRANCLRRKRRGQQSAHDPIEWHHRRSSCCCGQNHRRTVHRSVRRHPAVLLGNWRRRSVAW